MDSLKSGFGGDEEAWRLFVEAYQLQMKGRLDEAVALYQASIAARPTAEAHTFLGWAHSFRGDLERAIEFCKKAIATDPDFGNPYNDIGAYLLQMGRPREAIPWLERATHAPRYDAPHFPHANMGAAWEALDEPRRAVDSFRRALAIEPGHDFALVRLTALLGGMN